jgi:holo-[acyl-carrier protein] synthase
MILGLGNDLIDIRRMERSLERFGERFTNRVFTDIERARADSLSGPQRAGAYAKRFAAKEACAKALGTGIAHGVFLSDIGVVNLDGGRPSLHLTGGAAEHLSRLVPPGFAARIDLSLTDEPPMAAAVVLISAVPA